MSTESPPSPTQRVHAAHRRLARHERREAWIHLRGERDVLADARDVERRLAAGEPPGLAGLTVAVTDEIDVAGVPTSAGCPAYAYVPERDAVAVARLRAAGAIVLGKANLDQFGVGLTGTRSPYRPVRDVRRPAWVAGGSGAGAAVAVALGIADLGLVSDTDGGARVPAALQGLVAIVPAAGEIPTDGIVAAAPGLTSVAILARDLPTARRAIAALQGADKPPGGPSVPPAGGPAAPVLRLAIPGRDHLPGLATPGRAGLADLERRLRQRLGAELVALDPRPLREAGELLGQGGLAARRLAPLMPFVSAHRDAVDPSVAEVVLAAPSLPPLDPGRLESLRAGAVDALAGCDAWLLPTVPFQPRLDEVTADPIGVAGRLAGFTAHANALGLCAVSLPAGVWGGQAFGVTLYAAGGEDDRLGAVAARIA